MPATFGESLTLRPEGFQIDAPTINTFIQRVPGSYRRSESDRWNIVVPATDLQRWIDDPTPKVPLSHGPQCVVIQIDDDKLWIHPGYTSDSLGRAQQVVTWLLGFGPWHVTGVIEGLERDLGIIRSEQDIFKKRYYDPEEVLQISNVRTMSPLPAGELTTFSRRLDFASNGHYYHTFIRVHSSGSFSCEIESHIDEFRWEGQLVDNFVTEWNSLVAHLDLDGIPASIADNDNDSGKVSITVERTGQLPLLRGIDARRPPQSFEVLARLVDSWAEALLEEKDPPELKDLHPSPSQAPE